MRLFLCGDVMTGRGIDQILPCPCDPRIHEEYIKTALGYVELAEERNGPISSPVDPGYIWGDALLEMDRFQPDARIINLETAVTLSEDWVHKGINYRMHPDNISCLTAARIDCCSLANNHVLDWGHAGMSETLKTLRHAQVRTCGAGENIAEASAPAVIQIPNEQGRLLVFGFGMASSGVPEDWRATDTSAGVRFLESLSPKTVEEIGRRIQEFRRPGDFVVTSIHWGPNWGYDISSNEIRFAHRLVEEAGVDLFHGHSSHHPKAIEVHQGKLIIYGCGDLINDYEGITGYESFRGDLGLMYFVTVRPATGVLLELEMVPTQMRRLQVKRALSEDSKWLVERLNREGKRFRTEIKRRTDNVFTLESGGSLFQ